MQRRLELSQADRKIDLESLLSLVLSKNKMSIIINQSRSEYLKIIQFRVDVCGIIIAKIFSFLVFVFNFN